MKKRLVRSKNRMIGGVCAGFANYVKVDPTLIRLIFAVFTILTGFLFGILIYLAAWVIIPEK